MERIEAIDDPRVAAYRNLRDRTLRGESIFVTEGRVLTRRLLESRYAAESLFVADGYAEEFGLLVPPDVPVFVARESLLLDVVGFKFHRGVLGAGRRGPGMSLEEMLADVSRRVGTAHQPPDAPAAGRRYPPYHLVICPEITKPENMGLIFRTAAGLGMDGVLLGERCCDPFSRRCLRVSMGAVLELPFVKTTDLSADLRALKDRWHVELLAAVLDERAERLADVAWPPRVGLVVGNESEGIRAHWLAECHRRVTIPMQGGTDSLNLGVAAGICMYALMQRSDQP